MITAEGPKVVEYNCRFGDPECQVIIPRLESDLLEALVASVEGRLAETNIKFDSKYRCTVVLASGGYPQSYQKRESDYGLRVCRKSIDFSCRHQDGWRSNSHKWGSSTKCSWVWGFPSRSH